MFFSFRNENRSRLFYYRPHGFVNFFLSVSFRNSLFAFFCFFAALIQFVTFYLTIYFQIFSLCFLFRFYFVNDLFFHDIIFYFELFQNVFRFFVRNSYFFSSSCIRFFSKIFRNIAVDLNTISFKNKSNFDIAKSFCVDMRNNSNSRFDIISSFFSFHNSFKF